MKMMTNKKWTSIIVVVGLVCLLLTGCGGNKLDMKDYVTIEYSGLNGVGEAKVLINEDALLLDAIGEPSSGVNGSLQYMQDVFIIMSAISYQVEPKEGLSNGDTVTVTFQLDNESLKEKDIQLTGETLTFKVEGLEEGTTVDPFKDIDVSFEGISPDAHVVVTNNATDDFLKSIRYVAVEQSDEDDTNWIAKDGGLRLGDTMTLEARFDSEKATKAGYIMKESRKEYVVEGVQRYAESLAELDNDMQSFLDDSKACVDENWEHYGSAMKDVINATSDLDEEPYKLGESHYIIYKQTEPKMVGTYFMKAKEDENAKNNRVGLVYEITVNDSNINQDLTVYNVMEYNELFWETEDELVATRETFYSPVSKSFENKEKLQEYLDSAAQKYSIEQNITE